jgi:hypothetical protein
MDPDAPRKLTDDEIESIIDKVIPIGEQAYNENDPEMYSYPIPSSTYQTSMSIRDAIKSRLSKQLKDAPPITPRGIDDLIKKMISDYRGARAVPAGTVGISAAEMLGESITQATLRTFHQSGTATGIHSAIDSMRELLYVSEHKQVESFNIHFKNKLMSLFDVFDKRSEIVELTLDSKLVSDYEAVLREDHKLEWWHNTYCTLRKIYLPECKYVLRVTFKPEMLYIYQISLETVAQKIRNESNASNMIIVIPSPFSIGIVDVFPIDENIVETIGIGDINGVTSENKSSLFIDNLITTFPSIRLKGINKIDSLRPEKIHISKVVTEERFIAESPDKKKVKWEVTLSGIKMKVTGVSMENFKHLFSLTPGFYVKKIIYHDRTPKIIIMVDLTAYADDLKINKKTAPFVIVDIFVKKESEEIRNKELEARKNKEMLIIEGSDFYRAVYYHYAVAYSFNKKMSRESSSPFINLMARDDIDQRYTICNNVRDVNKYLGVEAARTHHIMSFSQSSEKSDIRHIILLVDFMTNMGEILPITFTGLQRQRMGPLDKATHEKSMDSFRDGAGMGVREEIKSISSEIAVGKRIGAGTGHMGVKIDNEVLAKYQHLYENAPAKLERIHLADEAARANVLIDTFKTDLFNETKIVIPEDIPMPEMGEDFGPGLADIAPSISSMFAQSASNITIPILKTEDSKTLNISTADPTVVIKRRKDMPDIEMPEIIRTTLGIPPLISNIFSIPVTEVHEQQNPDTQLPPLSRLEPPIQKKNITYNADVFIKNIKKLEKEV